jgi:RNA polymerase sigma factor (sigma-70 family)
VTKENKVAEGYSDDELLAGLRLQSEASYKRVYKEHFPQVNHFIISNNGNEDDAKDTFQEALLVLYYKLKDEDFRLTCKVGTYLFSVSRFLWLKKIRKMAPELGKVKDWEEFIPIEDDPEWSSREDRFVMMERALTGLGEPCKTLIEDFYIRNMSMQAIAEKFGYTNPENAKTQKYKCMLRLKKLFFSVKSTEV